MRATEQISDRLCEIKGHNGGMHLCNQALRKQNTYMAKSQITCVLEVNPMLLFAEEGVILLLPLVCYLDCKLFWAGTLI